MLTITKQSDYALLFIAKLREKKDIVSLTQLVKETKLPQRFLARIAAELAKSKIVESKEGKVGGYRLVADLNKVSLYEFLKIFEKDVAVCKCTHNDYGCKYEKVCKHYHFLKDNLNKVVVSQLKNIKLNQLFDK